MPPSATMLTFGSRLSESGVGTQIRIAPVSATAAKSPPAVSMPEPDSGPSTSSPTSLM